MHKSNLIYIGPRVYERTTILLDVEVLEYLQAKQLGTGKTTNELLNEILIKEVLESE